MKTHDVMNVRFPRRPQGAFNNATIDPVLSTSKRLYESLKVRGEFVCACGVQNAYDATHTHTHTHTHHVERG